ncbi:MAG: single-stranded-DNA-specific exonuclease RecJ, partial [Oscillospiraceae bacterium]
MLFSKWKYPRLDLRESKLIQKEYGISPMVADILTARGLNPAELADLLNADFISEDSMRMPDMEQAVLRIEQAIEQSERIAIYGDYDCDGVTATALLTTYLQSMGADVIYYIPERLDEGYGMNTDALDAI